MIIDTSVVVAIFRMESGWEALAEVLGDEQNCRMSAVSLVELTTALSREGIDIGIHDIDEFVSGAQLEVVAFTPEQATIAQRAHYQFGRRSGSKAKLNLCDCMTYALAKDQDEPLLFKGGDFNHTDLRIDERSVITGKEAS